jgi:hypothetical protein
VSSPTPCEIFTSESSPKVSYLIIYKHIISPDMHFSCFLPDSYAYPMQRPLLAVTVCCIYVLSHTGIVNVISYEY